MGLVTEPIVTKCSRPGGGKEKLGLTKLIWHGYRQWDLWKTFSVGDSQRYL